MWWRFLPGPRFTPRSHNDAVAPSPRCCRRLGFFCRYHRLPGVARPRTGHGSCPRHRPGWPGGRSPRAWPRQPCNKFQVEKRFLKNGRTANRARTLRYPTLKVQGLKNYVVMKIRRKRTKKYVVWYKWCTFRGVVPQKEHCYTWWLLFV